MDLSAINPVLLIASLMVAATPILLAAIGELVVEKAGVLNLGVEGMMIVGAICGFAIAVNTGSPLVGFVAAAVGGAVLSLLFVLLTQVALARSTAIEPLRMIWYSLSVSVSAGATVIESPVCTPIGSTFSIEQTMIALSARSRTTSISNSFQPSRLSSIRICATGEASSPRRQISK